MNYYKRHVGDYARKAGHLTMMEHGAYTLILDAYYEREQPLTQRECLRVARARTDEEKEAVLAVLEEFFEFDTRTDRYIQRRVEEELDWASKQADINRANGKKGGRPRKALRSSNVSSIK